MFAGKTLKGAGTGLIEMRGYTPSMETEGKLAVTGGGKKYRDLENKNRISRGKNLLAARASYEDKRNVLAGQNAYSDIASQNEQRLAGGIGTNMLSAKKGAKINPKKLSSIKKNAQYKVKIAKAQEGSDLDDGQKFALGGKINVIPEGALHARKNNYEGELAEQVTSKGIPVITYDEDDKIIQHAEIEHSEIIFNKDVTDQLEAWFKEYKEESADKAELEIKCGKFLTEEILENTEDNVGLIEQV